MTYYDSYREVDHCIFREMIVDYIQKCNILPDHYSYNSETEEFESELDMMAYGICTYTNNEVQSIIVHYLNDKSHCYVEIYLEDGDYEGMVNTAVSDEVVEMLERQWMRKHHI